MAPGSTITCWYSITPSAGTRNGSGIRSTRSGVPICHPSFQSIGRGASAGFPSGQPASTHWAMSAFWSADSRRSLRKWPWSGLACQGGMDPLAVTSAIIGPQWRASA